MNLNDVLRLGIRQKGQNGLSESRSVHFDMFPNAVGVIFDGGALQPAPDYYLVIFQYGEMYSELALSAKIV